MEKTLTPNAFKLEYLIQELSDLLQNDPASAPRLLENLSNIDYDFSNKEGYYKILNPEQRELLKNLHQRRKEDPKFDEKFQFGLTMAAGAIALGCGIGKGVMALIEKIDN